MRRFSWSTNSENFVKSSPGCWKAKNDCTWNPNDSYCCTGSTPSGQPSTTVAPARASASTVLDSGAVTSLETGACSWSSTTPARKSSSRVWRGRESAQEYAFAAWFSGPPVTLNAVLRSRGDRPSGPTADMYVMSLGGSGGPGGWNPVNGTIPALGFSPYTPQKLAGMRMEPTRSDPYSRNVIPADSAAAATPEEPPGVRAVSHGLLVTP